jgi:hypothetical protein
MQLQPLTLRNPITTLMGLPPNLPSATDIPIVVRIEFHTDIVSVHDFAQSLFGSDLEKISPATPHRASKSAISKSQRNVLQ